MPAKPKPTKEDRPKKPKTSASRRKVIEKQLEAIVKMIIAWRDGQVCVMGSIDGGRCGNGLMWNHFIAQGQSSWLRYNLGNVFWGCGSHNNLDRLGDPILSEWFSGVFGISCQKALREEATRVKQAKRKHNLFELEEILAHYDDLYQNRYTVSLDIPSLVEAGYFGQIIKDNFGT